MMEQKTYHTSHGPIRYWLGGCAEPGGPELVFLPGLTADHRLFDRQVEAFQGKYRVLVWDAPGHGGSWPFELTFSLMDKARWLSEILGAEGFSRPVLVGQSMGGYVGQAFLEAFPNAARGFVAIDSAPLQRRYITAAELWLLKRMEPVYRLYPWKALVRSGSEGCAVSEYGRGHRGRAALRDPLSGPSDLRGAGPGGLHQAVRPGVAQGLGHPHPLDRQRRAQFQHRPAGGGQRHPSGIPGWAGHGLAPHHPLAPAVLQGQMDVCDLKAFQPL